MMASRVGKTCKLTNPLDDAEAAARFVIVEDNGNRLVIEIVNRWHYRELVAEQDVTIIEGGNHGTIDGEI